MYQLNLTYQNSRRQKIYNDIVHKSCVLFTYLQISLNISVQGYRNQTLSHQLPYDRSILHFHCQKAQFHLPYISFNISSTWSISYCSNPSNGSLSSSEPWNKLSSLPSNAFVMPHFLNDLRITSGVIASHDCLIHESNSFFDGAWRFLDLVLSTGPVNTHSTYNSEICNLRGLSMKRQQVVTLKYSHQE